MTTITNANKDLSYSNAKEENNTFKRLQNLQYTYSYREKIVLQLAPIAYIDVSKIPLP